MYFQYGETEINYLKHKDKKLAWAIEQLGHIKRKLDVNLFAAVVRHIVGQQISSKAQATVWARMEEQLAPLVPATINNVSAEKLQSLGISLRKAGYIKDFARKVVSGEFALQAVEQMSDEEAITALSSLKGIGRWTAEMILLFCLRRPDILSFDDLAIQRGLRMLYHHRKITRELFNKYQKRYRPYGSTAALYLWAIAGGALPGMEDYATATKQAGKIKVSKKKLASQKKEVPQMLYYKKISSPLGVITLRSDGKALTGLWFAEDKHYNDKDIAEAICSDVPVFAQAEKWLAEYFSGQKPQTSVPLKFLGTPFQLLVWKILQKIPYGELLTYSGIAKKVAAEKNLQRMSAQAIGGAVGRNPLCLIVPCHRVVGANGSLTGYGGKIWRKEKLLQLEGVDMSKLTVPTKGTAL